MDKRFKKHFVLKKPHTEIKHALFEAVLKKSLSLGSALSSYYSYLDLFAGTGVFEKDGSIGSPVIALNIFKNHNFSVPPSHKIRYFFVHLCEKHGYEKLRENLRKKKLTLLPFIRGFIRQNWEDEEKTIKYVISKSKYGFIFADQFSTELNLRKFLNLLEGNRYEVLVFFNQNTLSRQKGRLHPNDVKRIAKVLAVDEDLIRRIPKEQFKKFVISVLREHFLKYRKYVSIAAIPITVGNSLIDADFFYLLFATNHPLILNDFLKAYSKAVLNRRAQIDPVRSSFGSLFGPTYMLEQALIEFFRENGKNKFTLNEIYLSFAQEFLSWRAYVNTDEPVPTLRNITYALRELEKRGFLKVEAPKEFVYKRGPRSKSKLGQKGQVNPDYLEKYDDLEKIKILVRMIQ